VKPSKSSEVSNLAFIGSMPHPLSPKAIMIMRTYALYERNFIILGGLAMLLVGQLVIMSVMEILEARRFVSLIIS